MEEPEPQATILVNGEEKWSGPWWKAWMRARALVADNRHQPTKIEIIIDP